jgi:hypothetical protein
MNLPQTKASTAQQPARNSHASLPVSVGGSENSFTLWVLIFALPLLSWPLVSSMAVAMVACTGDPTEMCVSISIAAELMTA